MAADGVTPSAKEARPCYLHTYISLSATGGWQKEGEKKKKERKKKEKKKLRRHWLVHTF